MKTSVCTEIEHHQFTEESRLEKWREKETERVFARAFQTVILVKFWVYEVSETRSIHGISSVINQYIGLVIKLL